MKFRARKTIEIKPFIKAGGQNQKGETFDEVSKIGADINYLITPTMKLNVTVNTDFAQVESDEVQVNLSRFSTDYPEKREFFLEGADLFNFSFAGGAYSFNSRKIGLKGEQEIPIIGGVRLIGKQGNTNIGLLSIQTNSKDSIPSENHSLIRIKQEINPNLSIGAILTSKINSNSYNYLYGADVKYNTANFLGHNKLYIGSSFSQTKDKKNDNNSNIAYSIWATYPNDLFYIDLNYSEVQENFNPGLGFLSRENYKRIYFLTKYKPRPESGFIQQLVFSPIELTQYYNSTSNILESSSFGIQPLSFYTKSGEYFGLSYYNNYEYFADTFNLIFNNYIPSGKYNYNRYGVNFQSFEGRDFSIGISATAGGYYNGTSTDLGFSLNYVINKFFILTTDYNKNFVDIKSGDFQTDKLGLRLEYSFNPKLYTSLYSQWSNIYERLVINFRVNWIPVVGSDFYLVVNQIVSTANSTMSLENSSVLVKYIYRLGI